MKNFSDNFIEFWDTLVQKMQGGHLFDDEFMNYLVSFLSAMSSSKVRAFRHTSSLALYQIIHSMIQVIHSFRKNADQLQKQKETEKKAKRGSRAEKQLKEQIDDINDKLDQLDHLIKEIFQRLGSKGRGGARK